MKSVVCQHCMHTIYNMLSQCLMAGCSMFAFIYIIIFIHLRLKLHLDKSANGRYYAPWLALGNNILWPLDGNINPETKQNDFLWVGVTR